MWFHPIPKFTDKSFQKWFQAKFQYKKIQNLHDFVAPFFWSPKKFPKNHSSTPCASLASRKAFFAVEKNQTSIAVSGSLNRWDWWYIYHPIGSIYHLYTTCTLPVGGLYVTYHLLREPGNSIEDMDLMKKIWSIQLAFCFFHSSPDCSQKIFRPGWSTKSQAASFFLQKSIHLYLEPFWKCLACALFPLGH